MADLNSSCVRSANWLTVNITPLDVRMAGGLVITYHNVTLNNYTVPCVPC